MGDPALQGLFIDLVVIEAAHYAVQGGTARITVGCAKGNHLPDPLRKTVRQRYRVQPAQTPPDQCQLASAGVKFGLHTRSDHVLGRGAVREEIVQLP